MIFSQLVLVSLVTGMFDPSAPTPRELSVARLFALPPLNSIQPDTKDGIHRIKLGTGFLVNLQDGEPWMLTAAHVVEGAIAVRASFSEYEHIYVKEIYLDKAHDQALLKLVKGGPPKAEPLVVRPISRGELQPNATRLDLIGFPLGFGSKSTLSVEFIQPMTKNDLDLLEGGRADPAWDIFQIKSVGEEGTSGSAIVDQNGSVVGIYLGGWNTSSDLRFFTSSRYIKDLKAITPRPLQVGHEVLDNLSNSQLFMRKAVRSSVIRDAMHGGELPSTLPVEEVPGDSISIRFFESNKNPFNEINREEVRRRVIARHKRITHTLNTSFGCGFLIPDGYLIRESFNEDLDAMLLTISKRSSDYKVRFYSRPLSSDTNLAPGGFEQFTTQVQAFLLNILKFWIPSPTQRMERPHLGEAMIAPGSWPGIYRERDDDQDLVTFRVYYEPVAGRIHMFMFGICKKRNEFIASGISFPISAFNKPTPTEEYEDLELLLNSAYDLELGLERCKQFREGVLPEKIFDLPTPTPGLGPSMLSPQLLDRFPSVPGQDQNIPIEVIPGIKPAENEIQAPELGIDYEMIRFQNGIFGARLTHNPRPGSPASNVQFQFFQGSLQKGDTIYGIDGQNLGQNGIPPLKGWKWLNVLHHAQDDQPTLIRVLVP